MIAEPGSQTVSVVADDSVMSSDRSVSIGLIVTELVINALKHAFPQGTMGGSITVTFASTPLGWVLTVADDGVGLAGDHAPSKAGLGTGIVNALAGQLAATVAVTNANPGTLISVTHQSGSRSDGDLKLTRTPISKGEAISA
jgi:two-component sensor histidine kinase